MKRFVLGLGILVVAGCASMPSSGEEEDFRIPLVCEPKLERLPCGAGVEQGVQYRFNLMTHCGIEWAYFDGRYWVPRPKVDTPSHWANIEAGTMVLRSDSEAVFEAEAAGGADFAPAAPSYRPRPCA